MARQCYRLEIPYRKDFLEVYKFGKRTSPWIQTYWGAKKCGLMECWIQYSDYFCIFWPCLSFNRWPLILLFFTFLISYFFFWRLWPCPSFYLRQHCLQRIQVRYKIDLRCNHLEGKKQWYVWRKITGVEYDYHEEDQPTQPSESVQVPS